MIHYRSFCNTDPPGLVKVWNESFTGRGAVVLRTATLLEYFLFAKAYFDPEGLIVAVDGDKLVGFTLGGFGPNNNNAGLDMTRGVICALGVVPSHRKQGIGAALAQRVEDYLRQRGAATLFAGPMTPLNPFTFGLYGGSQSPGFLDSDTAASPFFERRGYLTHEVKLVFQRPLDRLAAVTDGRFAAHRQRYEITVGPRKETTWWQECVFGPLELHDYRLTDKATGKWAARASLWEMETYSPAWNEHAVGLAELEVVEGARRKGLARFLLAQILHHVHEQFFTVAEIQGPEANVAAVNLIRSLGFTQVDRGRRFRRDA